MYSIAHKMQKHVPWLWAAIENVNEELFLIRYGRKLKNILEEEQFGLYVYKRLTDENAMELLQLLNCQPKESFEYFKPHAFDALTIKRLLKNKSYLAYGVWDNEKMVGYYFLRSYFIGKAYLGKLVDVNYWGKGIGKQMCLHLMDVATALGMHMYETISKENLSSLYATQKVLDTKVIKELPNNYLYIEDVRRKSLGGGSFMPNNN